MVALTGPMIPLLHTLKWHTGMVSMMMLLTRALSAINANSSSPDGQQRYHQHVSRACCVSNSWQLTWMCMMSMVSAINQSHLQPRNQTNSNYMNHRKWVWLRLVTTLNHIRNPTLPKIILLGCSRMKQRVERDWWNYHHAPLENPSLNTSTLQKYSLHFTLNLLNHGICAQIWSHTIKIPKALNGFMRNSRASIECSSTQVILMELSPPMEVYNGSQSWAGLLLMPGEPTWSMTRLEVTLKPMREISPLLQCTEQDIWLLNSKDHNHTICYSTGFKAKPFDHLSYVTQQSS